MRIDADPLRTIGLGGALAAGLLALTLLLGSPLDGISRWDAVAIARRDAQATSVTPVHLEVVRSAHLSDFRPAAVVVPPDRWVWAVVFTGKFPLVGGPPPGRRVFAHSRLVVIDYLTGEWLMAEEPSPIPLGIQLADA